MTHWWAVYIFVREAVLVAIVVSGYGLFVRRLATLVEPYRFQLAEEGEKYLQICRGQKERSQIQFYLDNAFNPWIAIAACVFIWIALPLVLIRSYQEFEPTIKNEYDAICRLFWLSVLAANPLFGLIVVIEITGVSLLVLLLAGNVALVRRAIGWMVEAKADRTRHLHAH